jgi:hypothetical protein
MDDPTETAFLMQSGRLSAMSLAITKLIALTTKPEETRLAIRAEIHGVISFLDSHGDDRHKLITLGMTQQMKDMLVTG